ncbi:MAG: VCBS repeat-containing protein [Enhygromyxa sp.]
MTTKPFVLGLLCTACLIPSACGRLGDLDREGFGTLGSGEGDSDELGEEPGSGGSISETCFDGVVQPGELCQVQAPEELDAGIDPCSLSVADFDGDGRPDLAVPNSDFWMPPGGTHVTNVLRGFGNGEFAKTQPHPAGEELPVGLAVGDFDGDGRIDITTANNDSLKAFLIRNNGGVGSMSFAAPEGLSVAATASSVTAGDLDNDGIDDIVVNTPSGVALARGTSSGFEMLETLDVGGSAMHSVLADLDHDGHLDLAVAVSSSFGAPGRLVILHGAGDGSFPERVEHGLAGDPWWVTAGDLNMDGDLDLVVADYSVASVSILLGNGLGGFSPRTEIGVCWGPQSVAIGDMNNDGANDLVVGCMDSDTVALYLQVEGGEFELTRWWATGSHPVSVQLADLNLDGMLDIAWANQLSNTVGLVLSHP